MKKQFGMFDQLIRIMEIIIDALTVNNPIWDMLGIVSQNPAEKKYTAKGYFRRERISQKMNDDILE